MTRLARGYETASTDVNEMMSRHIDIVDQPAAGAKRKMHRELNRFWLCSDHHSSDTGQS
jgi:hypothetical protein